MTRLVSLTASYETVDDGWVQARIEELPAVITAAPTYEEAKDLLVDALREYLLSLQADPGARPGGGERETLALVLDTAPDAPAA